MSEDAPNSENKSSQRGKAGRGNVNQITGNNNRVGGTNISFWLYMPIILLLVSGGAYFWLQSAGNGYNFPQKQQPSKAVPPSSKP